MGRKRKKARKEARQLVVVNLPQNATRRGAVGAVVGQVLVAGVVYAALSYLTADPKRRSVARFVAAHPRASADLAGMAANDARAKLRARAARAIARLRSWFAHAGATSSDQTLEEGRQLTYKPGSVGHDLPAGASPDGHGRT